jgi:hypothetical protein
MRTYAEAKEQADALEYQLAGYGEFFGVLASTLTSVPVELTLSNAQEVNFSAPFGIQTRLDYSRWPSKEEIAATLMEYYAAQQELRNTQRALSSGDRQLLGVSA